MTPVDVSGFQVDGRLAVLEEAEAFIVVLADDQDDWLARFEKIHDFPAREWAENMVWVYNGRLHRRTSAPATPRGTTPTSYHPGHEPISKKGPP